MGSKEARKIIFNHFGLMNQVCKLIEELNELLEAIEEAALVSGEPKRILNNPLVVDEAGDVLILLLQLLENNEMFRKMVNESISRKEIRTLSRIKEGYYESVF